MSFAKAVCQQTISSRLSAVFFTDDDSHERSGILKTAEFVVLTSDLALRRKRSSFAERMVRLRSAFLLSVALVVALGITTPAARAQNAREAGPAIIVEGSPSGLRLGEVLTGHGSMIVLKHRTTSIPARIRPA